MFWEDLFHILFLFLFLSSTQQAFYMLQHAVYSMRIIYGK